MKYSCEICKVPLEKSTMLMLCVKCFKKRSSINVMAYQLKDHINEAGLIKAILSGKFDFRDNKKKLKKYKLWHRSIGLYFQEKEKEVSK